MFQPLKTDDVREIARKYIAEVKATMQRWGKTLTIEPPALEKIVQEGYSLAYGARFLKRVIDDRIKLPISRRWKDVGHFRATVKHGEVVIDSVEPRLVVPEDTDAVAV